MTSTLTQERTVTTTPLGGRANKYAGTCVLCDLNVAAGAGALGKANGKWIVTHHHGDCPTGTTEAPKATFAPTAEQRDALALYATGQSMVIEAGAGTGKTSTLRLLAESDPSKRVQYLAFNKAIVSDVSGSMPVNVEARTAHSLAYVAIGKTYSARMKGSRRLASEQIAARLGVAPIFIGDGDARRALAPGFLAGHVMRALTAFCQSADDRPTVRHFAALDGVDTVRDDGTRSYDASNAIARSLVPALERAWADVQATDGTLPFSHAHYLKLWQLSHPHIAADVIMFDEAQDASPVMAAIVAEQTHAQRIYVGDSAQAIYEFTGAVNAIAEMKATGLATTNLTQSFRFGPAIADRANLLLVELDADLRLSGLDSLDSTLGTIEMPDAILTRTNACAVDAILHARENGVVAHLVGKGTETLAFAKAARDLMDTGMTTHPELACFTTWADVQRYVDEDAQGADLALHVRLVDKYGVPTIIEALERMPEEADADLIVSTAHKAKGREWDSVRIAADFVPQTKDGEEPKPPTASELRLRYVAITRAKLALDCTALDEKEEVAA